MMPALPLVLLAGSAASFAVGLFGKGGAAGGSSSSSSSTTSDGTPLKEGVPPELMAATQAMLQYGKDAAAMVKMAQILESYGYMDLANQLRERAANLNAAVIPNAPIPIPPAPTPTIPDPPVPVIPVTPPAAQTQTASVTGTDVNVRTSPSTSASSLGYVSRPEVVTVLNWNAGSGSGYDWAQVRTSRGTGYMAKTYLQLGGSSMPSPTPTPSADQTATVTGTGVNVRVGPSTSAQVLGTINKPEVVTVAQWNADQGSGYIWALVQTSKGIVGFVAQQYLSLNAPAPPAISGEEMLFITGAENLSPTVRTCVSPSGCRLRTLPRAESGFRTLVGNGEQVLVMKSQPGPKAEVKSPGPGGWSFVRYKSMTGWLPSEWLR